MSDDINALSEGVSETVCQDNQIAMPPECKVRFYNDDYTTMDFVVEVLMSVYHKAGDEAVELMTLVHKTGSAVVGTYTYDIAVTRVSVTTELARKAGFPLRCEVEE